VSWHDLNRNWKGVTFCSFDSASWHDAEWLSIALAIRVCCKCQRPDGTSDNICVRDVCPFIPFAAALGGYRTLLIVCLSPFGLDNKRRQQNYLTHRACVKDYLNQEDLITSATFLPCSVRMYFFLSTMARPSLTSAARYLDSCLSLMPLYLFIISALP